MVVGVEPRLNGIDGVVSLIRPQLVQQSFISRCKRGCGRDQAGGVSQARIDSIEIDYTQKMGAFISHVSNINDGGRRDFTLHFQAPRLRVWSGIDIRCSPNELW